MPTTYDAIVIGTGQAGPSLAARLAQSGRKTAVLERLRFGGTCVNVGCIPTKSMVASARAIHMARRGDEFGFTTGGAVQVNMPRVKARKDDIVRQSSQGVEEWMRNTANITVYDGHGRFTSANTVSVNGDVLQAAQIFINVGARANVPDFSAWAAGAIAHQYRHPGVGRAARTPAHRRRQLHRPRVRADVPPLRQSRDRDREERPPDRARRRRTCRRRSARCWKQRAFSSASRRPASGCAPRRAGVSA